MNTDNNHDVYQRQRAILDRISDDHFILTGGPNQGEIVSLKNVRRKPTMLKREKFRQSLAGLYVPVIKTDSSGNASEGKALASEQWLKDPESRRYTDIVFEPTGSRYNVPDGAYNEWTGLAVEPQEGDAHEPFLQHLRDHVCGGDEKSYEWLLAWLADLVQRPGDKPGTAIALHGEQGAGKGTVFGVMREILGKAALPISSEELLTGRFGGHFYGAVLLGVDEAHWAGGKAGAGKIKAMITEPEITIEQKYHNPITIHNHLHLMVTSNEKWFISMAEKDRRWAVFEVTSDMIARKPGAKAYWDNMWKSIKDGSLPSNLLHFLLEHEYKKSRLKVPPMTKGRSSQIMQTVAPHKQWWCEVLGGHVSGMTPEEVRVLRGKAGDESVPEDDVFGQRVAKAAVFKQFKEWQKDHRRGEYKVLTDSEFWIDMRKLTGSDFPRRQRGKTKVDVVDFPSRDKCIDATCAELGLERADAFPSDDDPDSTGTAKGKARAKKARTKKTHKPHSTGTRSLEETLRRRRAAMMDPF